MRDIAKLLFGEGADGLLGLFGGGDGDGFGMADRARRSGEWCGSTPGRSSAGDADRGPRGPIRRRVIIREWQSH
ncbi:MAG: hypothetical protein ACRDNW_22820 [Trebonia sp.]